MAKFQLHLPRTVRAVIPIGSRDNTPLPVQIIEDDSVDSGSSTGTSAAPRKLTREEQRLQQQVEQFQQEALGVLQRVERKLDELGQAEAARIAEYRQLAVRLAMIATRAVLREVSASTDQRLEQLISDGLSQIPGQQEVSIRLHPSVCDRIAYHFESAGLKRPVQFLSDPNIPPGEVQLDHPLFSLGSNLAEQLEQLEQTLAEEVQP